MDIRCPQCEQTSAVEPTNDGRYSCVHCAVQLFHSATPDFPPIAAVSFPAQQQAPVALKSFFMIAEAQVPAAWHITRDFPAMSSIPEPPNNSVTAEPTLSRASLEATPAAASSVDVPHAIDQPPPPLPAPSADHLDDDVEISSMAGGSFSAALTAAPSTPPPLSGQVTTPPPWDPATPLAGAKEETWSVGPPALPQTRMPPPLTKKPKTADDFARALGLPDIAIHEPERPVAPPVAKRESDDEEKEETGAHKTSKKPLVLAGLAAVLLIGGAVVAAMRAPTPPVPSLPEPTPSLAASPDTPSAPSAPTPSNKPAADSLSAEKRAKVVEHYNLGNKHYLKGKYPAALEEFKAALEVDPSFALAHRGMGVTLARQRKAEEAIKEYKTYLKLAPDAKDAKQVEKMIKEFEQ